MPSSNPLLHRASSCHVRVHPGGRLGPTMLTNATVREAREERSGWRKRSNAFIRSGMLRSPERGEGAVGLRQMEPVVPGDLREQHAVTRWAPFGVEPLP